MATVELVNPRGKTLLFVIPAYRRVEMARICYAQIAELMEQLQHGFGIKPEALVISGDGNLEAAEEAGLATIEYGRDEHLGGKLNAGYSYAAENGYEYVCAVGNDSWLHPDRFAWFPGDDAILCTRNYSCVSPDGKTQGWFKFREEGGTGSRVIPLHWLEACDYKPLPVAQHSGCDTGTLITICRGRVRAPHLIYTDLHPYEVVGFQSDVQITPWAQFVRKNLVSWQEPWTGLAAHYGTDLVERMQDVYEAVPVA